MNVPSFPVVKSPKLTSEMKEMIGRLRLCYAATVTPDHQPNLSPKGSLKVLDDEHLIFAEMASPNTVRNLRHNPAIEINVVDPILRRGYRFKGVAEVLDDPELIALAGQGLGAEYPVRSVVKIRVERAAAVRSPVYLFTDSSEEDVRDMWMQIYGFDRRAE
jgi:predicted pyridoxine 5'-phosphate oxidase superfamily flavin-nucleotide-binding protein